MSPRELSKDEIQRIYQVKTFILNNLDKKLTVAELARMAAMNEKKFNEGFYFLFGYHVGPYLLATRMLTAQFFLIHSERPIKEIAALTGYSHTKNFMKAFARYFNKTAGSVRKNR